MIRILSDLKLKLFVTSFFNIFKKFTGLKTECFKLYNYASNYPPTPTDPTFGATLDNPCHYLSIMQRPASRECNLSTGNCFRDVVSDTKT